MPARCYAAWFVDMLAPWPIAGEWVRQAERIQRHVVDDTKRRGQLLPKRDHCDLGKVYPTGKYPVLVSPDWVTEVARIAPSVALWLVIKPCDHVQHLTAARCDVYCRHGWRCERIHRDRTTVAHLQRADGA